MTVEQQAKRQTCTDHCSSCGRHFHGLKAFDSHQRLGECLEPAGLVSDKTGKPLLQPWTTDGHCSLAPGCRSEGQVIRWLHPVTIWQVPPSEAASEFFKRKKLEG